MRPPALASLLAVLAILVAPAATAAESLAVADAWVDGLTGQRDTNHGASQTLRVRNSGARISFIRFAAPLPDPTGHTVTLNLVVHQVNRAGQVEARLVLGKWNENTVTFNTRPAIATAALSARVIGEPELRQVVRFDVTSAVRGWRANPASNNGIAVLASPGSLAEIYFESREGAAAPSLRVADASEVTVSHAGGDYSDIGTAMANAYSGDRWCAANPPQFRCTVNVDAGVFVVPQSVQIPAGIDLAGREKGQTIVVAAPGLLTLFQAIDSSVRDLTLLNLQATGSPSCFTILYTPFGAAIVNPIRIERVAARLEGTGFVHPVFFDNMRKAEIHVADSEFIGRGGDAAGGLDVTGINGPVTVVRSTMIGEGGFSGGLSVVIDDADAIVRVEDSVANGISMSGSRAEALEVVRTHVTGELSVFFSTSNLLVLDSQIGGGDDGIMWRDSVGSVSIDGTSIDADQTAFEVANFITPTPLEVAVMRSQLIGQIAIRTNGGISAVHWNVQQSLVQGEFLAVTGFGHGSLDIDSSLLEGGFELQPGFTLHCGQQVYDKNLRLRDANCASPP